MGQRTNNPVTVLKYGVEYLKIQYGCSLRCNQFAGRLFHQRTSRVTDNSHVIRNIFYYYCASANHYVISDLDSLPDDRVSANKSSFSNSYIAAKYCSRRDMCKI